MVDNNPEDFAKEALVTTVKERSKDIYDDGLKPVVKEAGEIVSTIVGIFNHIILYPVKKANLTYKYKLESFRGELEKKVNTIPPERLVEPPLLLSGPLLESLKYSYDNEYLRKMYLNLLSKSMDIKQQPFAHPSYVEIIKQLSPLDAKVFKSLFSKFKQMALIPCANIRFTSKADDGKRLLYYNYFPKYYIDLPEDIDNENEGIDSFCLSISLDNLNRLSLINCTDTQWSGSLNYDDHFTKDPFVIQQLESLSKIIPSVEIKIYKMGILLTDFGKYFAKICLTD